MQKYLNMYVCSRILYIKCIQSEKINVSKNHFFYIFKTNIRNVYFKVTFKCYNNELVWLNFGICMTYSLKFLLLMATSGV